MKCWLISDTHGCHAELRIPTDVDVVIHCGDESKAREAWKNEVEARDFFEWFSALEIPHRIFIPGNHSIAIEQGLVRPEDYPAIRFLIHERVSVQGLRVFGTPYTPRYHDWAFMRDPEELDELWQSIPDDIDVLISHGPPNGILDRTLDFQTHRPVHVGSQSLTRHVMHRIQPKLHAFGHIHDELDIDNFGSIQHSETLFVNCSCVDQSLQIENHGVVVLYDRATGTIALA